MYTKSHECNIPVSEKEPQALWISFVLCRELALMNLTTMLHCYFNGTVLVPMITSWNGNFVRIIGPLCGKFTGDRWILLTKASDSGFAVLSLICARTNGWVNNRDTGNLTPSRSLWRHCNSGEACPGESRLRNHPRTIVWSNQNKSNHNKTTCLFYGMLCGDSISTENELSTPMIMKIDKCTYSIYTMKHIKPLLTRFKQYIINRNT